MRNINIWMQLLGFERDDEDRGVSRFLEHIGFVPGCICALFFNSDFVHLHRGMGEEYTLFDDNCAYYGIERGPERARQPWTNYDIRALSRSLKARGIPLYAGIMGVYTHNKHHHEWLSDHPELRCVRRDCIRSLMCLKRFADGSYYEDFFIKKLVATLCDYELAGVHLSDAFCPTSRLYLSDYSDDMISQFYDKTGIAVSGDDTVTRADWIWANCRREWIGFYEWRWEKFFKKLTSAVHAVGKEVWILGMYCTDPFETRYTYGFDMRRLDFDCVTANILPTSVHFATKDNRPYFYHRMHMDVPFLRASIPDRKILTMIGVADASEGWNVIDKHRELVKRDIMTALSFVKPDSSRATDGIFFCLGDGVSRENWKILRDTVGAGYAAPPYDGPFIVWSDTAHDKMLDEYIKNRRPSPHKQAHELFARGCTFSGCVRTDALWDVNGILFVPNYDLLSEDEKSLLAGRRFVATAAVGFETDCDFELADVNLRLFTRGVFPSGTYTVADDGAPDRKTEPERDIDPLCEELPFAKMNDSFLTALAEIIKEVTV